MNLKKPAVRFLLITLFLSAFFAVDFEVDAFVTFPPTSSFSGSLLLKFEANSQNPIVTNGYALFLADGSGYEQINIHNQHDSSGTYSSDIFGNASSTTGRIVYWDSALEEGFLFYLTLQSQDSSQENTFDWGPGSNSDAGPGGIFSLAEGAVPAMIASKSFSCTITDGLSPFATNGSFTLTLPAGENVYSITGWNGPGTNYGTYIYSNLNSSTSDLELNDSQAGSNSFYLGFSNSVSGWFAIKNTNTGGFQVGTFTMVDEPPALFFTNQSSLGSGWYLLKNSSAAFGFYSSSSFPFIYHLDMGWEYFYDAGNSSHGGYFFDFADNAFFYTDPHLFPYIYDFNRNAWLFYSPQSGATNRYTSNPRWFYDLKAKIWINHL